MNTQHLNMLVAGMGFGFMSFSYFICRTAGKLVWRKVTLSKQLKKMREAA